MTFKAKPGPWNAHAARANPRYRQLWDRLMWGIPLTETWDTGYGSNNRLIFHGAGVSAFDGGSGINAPYIHEPDESEITWTTTPWGRGLVWASGVENGDGIRINSPRVALHGGTTEPPTSAAILFLWDGTTGDERALISQDESGSLDTRLRISNDASPADLQSTTDTVFSNAITENEWYLAAIWHDSSLGSSHMQVGLRNLSTGERWLGGSGRGYQGEGDQAIYFGANAGNDAAVGLTVAGCWVWSRSLGETDFDLLASDPFGMFQLDVDEDPVVTLLGVTTILYATGDGTIQSVVNELDTTTNLYQSVDDDPDTPTDTDYVNNRLILSAGDASVFFELTDMPGDFDTATAATIKIRVRGQSWLSGSDKLYGRLYQSNETTVLSDEVELREESSDTSFTNYTATFTGIVAGSKTIWDGARLRLRWSDT